MPKKKSVSDDAVRVSKKNGTVVSVCAKNCKHAYQDSVYGIGRRLFNIAGQGAKVRCTVCGDVRNA